MKQEIKERIEQINNGIIPEGYKKTSLGIIPIGWDICKFNHMFSRLMRKNKENNSNVLTISAQYGLISQTEFFNKDVSSEDKSNYYLLYKGDFSYNKSYSTGYPFGAIKQLSFYDKGIVSPLYICMQKTANNTCPEYYLQYFEAGLFNREIKAIAQEGARNHGLLNIAVGDFFNTNIIFPPYQEQEKIAKILSAQDKVIELRQKEIEQLQILKKYYLQTLFPEKWENIPKIRFSEFHEPWERKALSDTAVYRNGKAHEKDISEVKKYCVVNSKFVSTGGELRKFSEKAIEPLYKNEIAFVLSDIPNGRALARTYLVEDNYKYTLNQRVAGITPKENTDPYFLSALMNRNAYFIKFDDGVNQTNLSKKDVMRFKACYPTKSEQVKIGEFLKTIDNIILLYKHRVEQEKQKKKALMQLLLTGIVRVKND